MEFLTGFVHERTKGEGDHDTLHLDDTILAEFLEDFNTGSPVWCSYGFAPEPIDKESFLDMAILSAEGMIDAEWGYAYSDITGYLWTNENGEIGGHDMLEIFRSHLGEYGAICIDTKPLELMDLFGLE